MADAAVHSIGFLGAGKMATALARAWRAAGLVRDIHASDPVPAARESFRKDTGVNTSADNGQVVAASDVLVLAVKPQHMAHALDELRPVVTSKHLIVSVAAGVTIACTYIPGSSFPSPF